MIMDTGVSRFLYGRKIEISDIVVLGLVTSINPWKTSEIKEIFRHFRLTDHPVKVNVGSFSCLWLDVYKHAMKENYDNKLQSVLLSEND